MPKTLAKLSMLDIANAVAKTSPALADLIALYDAAGTANKRMTLENLFKTIGLLGVDGSPDTGNDFLVSWDASAAAPKRVAMAGFLGGGGGGLVGNGLSEGRLTLASGDPVPVSNLTAQTSLYWSPWFGNRISLYDGSAWTVLASGERAITLAGLPANTNHDVWGYKNGLNMDLELTAWTNDTTRAVSLARQDGVRIKAGDPTRRHLGTIRTVAAGQCEDSAGGSNTIGRRFVWNAVNRVPRRLHCTEAASSWPYTTGAWRRANANVNVEARFVIGERIEPVRFRSVYGGDISSATSTFMALAMDWASGAPDATTTIWNFGPGTAAYIFGQSWSELNATPVEGYHFVHPIEFGAAGANFFGSTASRTAGLTGYVMG